MSEVKVDTISERTTDAGVTVEGVKIEDGVATFQTAAGSPLVFEGATANDFETTFAFTDPTADRTITFPDADITLGASGDNTPAWQMSVNGNQMSMTSQTTYTVNFDTVDFDTDSGCNTTDKTYTVPAGEGGKYMVGVWLWAGQNKGAGNYIDGRLRLREDPAPGAENILVNWTSDWDTNPIFMNALGGARILTLSAGDILYCDIAIHVNAGGNYGIIQDQDGCNVFYGYKLIGI